MPRRKAVAEPLVRRIPAVLWTADRDLRLTASEGLGLEALGLRPGEAVGRTLAEFFGTDDPGSPPLAAHRAALDGRGGTFDASWKGRRYRGGVEPLAGPDGGVAGVVGVAVDVTDAAAPAEDPSGRSRRLEAVGRLAGGVAHDFNNALTVIRGYADLVLDRLEAGDPLRRYVAEIRQASEQATALTGQLLALSRRQVLVPRVLDLREALAGMEPALRGVLGEDVRLDLRPCVGAARVRVDPGRLADVVMHLATNARDAMPRGGTLVLETRLEASRTPPPAPPPVPPGPWVVLVVSDDGEGMGPEALEHLFEPFYTTKDRGQGKGLGLATVYGVVRQSGGHVEVQSARGAGTRVRVWLPFAAEEPQPAPSPSPAPPAPRPARRGRGVILVVEDEESIRDLVRSTLSEGGYTVLTASGGKEALGVIEGRAEPPDLLVTDVVMPQMNGGELARAFRARCPGAKVIFMSGSSEDHLARQGISDDREAFLRKPFSPNRLLAKVREVLDG